MTAKSSICCIFLMFTMLSVRAYAVPVIPNQAVVHGLVIEYCASFQPARKPGHKTAVAYRIVVAVRAVESAGDFPNFLVEKKGQEVEFSSDTRLDSGLLGKKVRAVVEYRGDERGGRFELLNVEIEKH